MTPYCIILYHLALCYYNNGLEQESQRNPIQGHTLCIIFETGLFPILTDVNKLKPTLSSSVNILPYMRDDITMAHKCKQGIPKTVVTSLC